MKNNPESFIKEYSDALASQDFNNIIPLINRETCVTFSNGAVHKGMMAIAEAYRRNFSIIKGEEYSISDVHWIHVQDDVAIYLFRFSWKGVIDGEPAAGSGRGTATIKFDEGRWTLVAEHLGPGE
jgi:ketosteroid isomerase-like protein